MDTLTATAPMTTEELLALPEDGIDRELIRGELREEPMSERNPQHSRITVNLSYLLKSWLSPQAEPRGEAFAGDTRFRIRQKPDTTVGIDVAYISAELASATPEGARFIDGVPVLAVEILSPSDTQERITDKIAEYLDIGVALVWIIEPVFRTITIYRPDARPQLVNDSQTLSGEPHLPGFQVAVADVFRR